MPAPFTLVVGSKNRSSWSLRPYLVLRQTGAHFDEVVVDLDGPETRREIAKWSPSGRVPCLIHEGRTIWDSLAISEYLHEIFPDAGLWPDDRPARAQARALTAEMHSGFAALRNNMSMNITAELPGKGRTDEVERDIARITEVWRETRERFAGGGGGGEFLFGKFTIADAFFAPVVTRFRSYGVALGKVEQKYAEAIWALPAMKDWVEAARQESAISRASHAPRV